MYHTADSLLKMSRSALVRAATSLGLRVVGRPSAVLVDDICVRQGELLSRNILSPADVRIAVLEDQCSRLERALVEQGEVLAMVHHSLRMLCAEHGVPLDKRLAPIMLKYKTRANLGGE